MAVSLFRWVHCPARNRKQVESTKDRATQTAGTMKKYLTETNLVMALLIIGIATLAIVIFFPNKGNDATLDILQDQQKQMEQLTQQLQRNDQANRKRDSILLNAFERNNSARNATLEKTKQSANEKIDHINQPSFNADSIRRYFANN
jgi:type II secretory pathway pseudopilin PulG